MLTTLSKSYWFGVVIIIFLNVSQASHLRGDENLPREKDRGLLSLLALPDPKSVVLKQEQYLWHLMSPSRQTDALAEVMQYMKAHADKLNTPGPRDKKLGKCNLAPFGSGYGGKFLCEFPSALEGESSCNFISFGIAHDFSFDVDLATKKKCRGFAADPTVIHPSHLETPFVTFHNIGAKTLHENSQQKGNLGPEWWLTSVPALKRFLRLSKINVLKMDCEGCEYSLARDIIEEEPDFFDYVDQFSFEAHLTKVWMADPETLYYFGLLLKLLDDAGFKLQNFSHGGCSARAEEAGCMDELKAINYPCCPNSCHAYLFAKAHFEDNSME